MVNMSQSPIEPQSSVVSAIEQTKGDDVRNDEPEKFESDGNVGDGFNGGDGNGGGGGGDDGEEDYEEKEFGPILKFEEVMRETEARGAKLPCDMLEAAKTFGIRKLLLLRYLDLQGIMYGAVGFGCGIVGQGIANLIMTAKRSINKSEEDIPVPPPHQ